MDRRLMIAAPSSNTGKTLISLALLRAIGREEKVRGYKVGPDYIDADYLSQAAGRPAENLDLFLMDEKNINKALAKDGFKIIEGVMGYLTACKIPMNIPATICQSGPIRRSSSSTSQRANPLRPYPRSRAWWIFLAGKSRG